MQPTFNPISFITHNKPTSVYRQVFSKLVKEANEKTNLGFELVSFITHLYIG